jgi:hypothetical protein
MIVPYRLSRPKRLALYALATAILFVMCLLPTEKLPDPGTGDRFEHTAAWFVLTATGYLLAPRRAFAIAIFAIAYGAVIEVLQGIEWTGRHSDPLDFAADVAGVGIAVVIYALVHWMRRP